MRLARKAGKKVKNDDDNDDRTYIKTFKLTSWKEKTIEFLVEEGEVGHS